MLRKEQINAIKVMFPFLPMDFCLAGESTMNGHEFRLRFLNRQAEREMQISNAVPTCPGDQTCWYSSEHPTDEEIEETHWGGDSYRLYCVWDWVGWREEDMECQKKMCRLFVSPHPNSNKRG